MSDKPRRLPVYERLNQPPPIKLRDRDRAILQTIHAFDGMLGDYQLQRLFFPSRRMMQQRMSLLYQHAYVNRPTREERGRHPCMIYTLGESGAAYLASLSGTELADFKWRKKPRKSPDHDLQVNDFRLAVLEACALVPEVSLEEWVHQGVFWASGDAIEYTTTKGKTERRQIRPDGYFSLVTKSGYRSRFLLEIDRGSEDQNRIVREKVVPGVAYLRSDPYYRRTGFRSGRWLMVTTGMQRMLRMKRYTEHAVERAAGLFFFTTFDLVKPETLITGNIWYRGGVESPLPLIKLNT